MVGQTCVDKRRLTKLLLFFFGKEDQQNSTMIDSQNLLYINVNFNGKSN